jgi:RNA polymerase sigma-70 factor (ECF subfamily)
MPSDRKSDSALVPLDEETVRVLVDNHRRFRAFLTKRVDNEADAEEILQQSLSKAVEHGLESLSEESVLAWFYHVLRNGLTDYYRTRASNARKLNDLAREVTRQTSDAELKAEVCACMSKLLPTLKADTPRC